MKLNKDHHGLGITIAGYTNHSGLFFALHLLHFQLSLWLPSNWKNIYITLLLLYYITIKLYYFILLYITLSSFIVTVENRLM